MENNDYKNERIAFGRHIKILRTDANLTQKDLGNLIGCDQRFISKLEKGIKTPSFSLSIKLAQALKIELSELYEFQHLL
jgi:transcriptional regulator with XRE-family HTH domain